MPKAKTISRMTLIVFVFFVMIGQLQLQVCGSCKSAEAAALSHLRRDVRSPEETGGFQLKLLRSHAHRSTLTKLRTSSGEAFAHRRTAQDAKQGSGGFRFDKKGRRNANVPVCLFSLTDIIEDMFPGLLAEDEHRIAVAKDAVTDHQAGSEENDGHQHEYQNPHHC